MKNDKKKVFSIRPVWGLICSSASIDQESNNISLFNIISQINIFEKAFPQENKNNKLPFNHELVVLFRRILNIDIDNKEFSVDVKLELVDPNGKILTETIAPLIFKKNKRQMRFVIRMDSFIYTIPGDYLYKISVKQLNDKSFKISHEIPLEVKSV